MLWRLLTSAAIPGDYRGWIAACQAAKNAGWTQAQVNLVIDAAYILNVVTLGLFCGFMLIFGTRR